VLPFTNMSADPENEYFADGLSEELLNQLAQIPDLMVSGRTSSFSFKGRNEDLRSIGSTLGVANVLEGSVRRQGDQVRVTTQLIRVSDGFHLWSNTYDRLIEDVFAIQDDIARNVAAAMKIVLDEASRQSMQEAGVRNVEAFIAFQKGTQLFEEAHGSARLIETLAEGMTHFDRAIALVPEFGAAYWHKSDYYAHILIETDSSGEQRIQALSDLRKVLDAAYEHSPNAGRRAFIDVDRVLFSADWTPLRARIEKALAATGCPDPTWIQLADIMGYAEAMARMWERYLRCEPLNAIGYAELSTSYLISGRPEQALEQIAVALEQLGNHPWLSWARQNTLLHLGRIDEALAEAPLFIDEEDFVGIRAEAAPLALAGKADDALAAMAAWVEDHGPEPRASISILAAAGQRQQANEVAAMIDARPAGPLDLLTAIYNCLCGAPFDLEATPNLQARIGESGVPWPPPRLIDYPAKDW
jgi:TolB-like protein